MQDIHPPKGYKLIIADPSIALSHRRHRELPACVWQAVDAVRRLGGPRSADVDQDDVEAVDKNMEFEVHCKLMVDAHADMYTLHTSNSFDVPSSPGL